MLILFAIQSYPANQDTKCQVKETVLKAAAQRMKTREASACSMNVQAEDLLGLNFYHLLLLKKKKKQNYLIKKNKT